MKSMKRQKDRILKDELPRSVGANMLLENSGELTPERMKRLGQNDAQSVEVSDGENKVQHCKNSIA